LISAVLIAQIHCHNGLLFLLRVGVRVFLGRCEGIQKLQIGAEID